MEVNDKMKKPEVYRFRGDVYHFEHLKKSKWTSYTSAYSYSQAENFFKAQAKMMCGYEFRAKITLKGKIEKVSEEESP